jgi:integrase
MRFPKPFFRTSKNCWYVQFGKKQHSLHTADEGEALKEYGRLLTEQETRDTSDPRRTRIYQCFEVFLEHSKEEHAERSYAFYQDVLSKAAKSFGQVRLDDLKPHHVTAWLRTMELSDTTRAHYIGMVKASLNYCMKQGHIEKNPIAHMEKPTCSVRDRILDDSERKLILSSVRDQTFRDLLLALQESGARPGEIANLTAANVNLDAGTIVWFTHKTGKKTKKPRVIYMTPLLRKIIKRRLALTKEGGYLFVGRKGNPWTRSAFYSRFRRLRELHPELKGVVPYSFRHSYCTDALEHGIPDATVAELMGHTSTTMVHKHYAHLEKKKAYLAEMAKKARGGDA